MSDIDRLAAGLRRLQELHGGFVLEMSFSEVVTLVGHLQLALRHPRNVGQGARNMRGLVDRIIASIEASDTEVAELLRRGDDPAHDVRTPGPLA